MGSASLPRSMQMLGVAAVTVLATIALLQQGFSNNNAGAPMNPSGFQHHFAMTEPPTYYSCPPAARCPAVAPCQSGYHTPSPPCPSVVPCPNSAAARRRSQRGASPQPSSFSPLPSSPIPSQTEVVDTTSSRCVWKFASYVPSPFETAYYNRSDEELKYPCKLLNAHFPDENQLFFNTTTLIHNPPLGEVKCDLTPIQPPESIYSYSWYENSCTMERKKLFLEPLAGVLRHPGTCVEEKKYFLEKGYFLIDGWHTSKEVLAPNAKRFFFDLGASTWNSGLGGASQGWFYEVFKSLCAEFDALFGWEFVVHAPDSVFSQIPAALHYKYHWYNIPVTLDFKSPSHPFNMIRQVATPDDFVVLKIDVDTPSVELPLIQYMLDNPDLLALIDEFFFEHHVVMEPLMSLGWGGLVSGTPRDTIDIFTKMRNQGVRAHSWL